MSSIGSCSSSEATCANVVSWPCPWLCDPVKTLTLPVGCTRTVALSYKPAWAPSDPTTCEGANPQAST